MNLPTSICSAASADLHLQPNAQDSAQSDSAKSSLTPAECLPSDSQACRTLETCESESLFPGFLQKLSAQDTHASLKASGGEDLGKDDPRWLWPAVCELLSMGRPTWFIGENVLGHISSGLDTVLADLESIGYAAQPFVIPACAIGAAHMRNRVWILAHAGSPRRQGREPQPRVSCGQSAAHSKPGNRMLDSWDKLAGHSRGLRCGDGVSVQMVRRELHAYGNAIVPKVAEPFFHWIAQIERGEITESCP